MSDSQMRRASNSNVESTLLLGVVRSEGRLLAVVSQRRVAAAAAPRPATAEYAVLSVPVGGADQRLLAEKARLCAAWERLCDVAVVDGSALADVLTVLLSTVPAALPDTGRVLRLTAPPPLPRRTAAHPRAFKGTKYTPPKRPRPAVLDLRSALCSNRNTHAVLERLWPWRAEALDQLARLRFDQAGVALGHGAGPERYERWARALLAGLARKLNPTYLAAGIRFAVAYAPTWGFGELADDAPDFGPSTPAALLAALPTEWNGDWLMSLWDTCGVVPGFANLIEQADWRELSPPQRMYLLRFFTDLRWHQDRHALDPRRWRAIEPFLPRIEELARTVPTPYTDQAMNDLGELVAQMDTPKHIRDCLPLALDLLARVNRPPFCDDGNMVTALSNLLRLPERERGRVLGAPESSFRQLDRACLRRNAASLVAWGMSTLVAHAPALVADAFASAPVSLFRTAQDLR